MGNILFHLQFPAPELPNQFIHDTLFESIDGYVVTPFAPGTINFVSGLLTIDTAGAASAGGRLRKYVDYPGDTLTWTNDRSLEFGCRVEYGNELNATLYISMGYNPLTGHGIAIFFTQDKIIGRTGDGTTYASIDLLTGLVKPWNKEMKLKIEFEAGIGASFYIDDVQKGQITTPLPSSSASARNIFDVYVSSVGAITHRIKLSKAKFTQNL